jgi:GH24 family phage-related lysozyme (muramidase)
VWWVRHETEGDEDMHNTCRNLLLTGVLLSVFACGCEENTARSFPSLDKRAPGSLAEPVERGFDMRGPVRAVYAPGLQLTKVSEGFVGELYNDAANYCTIAYGHLIKLAPCDGTEPAEFLQGVTEVQGTELLVKDMRKSQLSVMRSVAVDLTDGQYAALCDFVFNVGSGNFSKSTLLKILNDNDFEGVPFQLRRWVKAGGRELEGLKKRREREIALFFEGQPIPRAVPRGIDLSPVDIDQGERI